MINTDMKVTLFLKIGDARGAFPKPQLYAYSHDKTLVKSFKESRNMDLFIEKVENMDKKQYDYFRLKNKATQLIPTELMTKSDKSFTGVEEIPITLTYHEEEFIFLRQDSIFNEMARFVDYSSMSFEDKIIDALDALSYFDIYNFFYNCDLSCSAPNSITDLLIDRFALFMFFFGQTMK